jgi:hypothetical protein
VTTRDTGQQADPLALSAVTGLNSGVLTDALCAATDAGMLQPMGTVRQRLYAPALFLDRYIHLRAEQGDLGGGVALDECALGTWQAA